MGVTYYMGVIFYIRLDDFYLKNVFLYCEISDFQQLYRK